MTDKDIFSGRLKALSVVVVLVIVVLIARMGYLQVYDGDYYASLADGNRIRLGMTVTASCWLLTIPVLQCPCCL